MNASLERKMFCVDSTKQYRSSGCIAPTLPVAVLAVLVVASGCASTYSRASKNTDIAFTDDAGTDASLAFGGPDGGGPPAVYCGNISGLEANAPWPMRGRCPAHPGRTLVRGPQTATKKWEFATPYPVVSSPTISADGTVYIASADAKLYALRYDGNAVTSRSIAIDAPFDRATYPSGRGTYSVPAISVDRTVIIGSSSHSVHAISTTGAELAQRWSRDLGNWVSSSAVVREDRVAFIGGADGNLYALSLDGAGSQTYRVGYDGVDSSPALDADGVVYVGSPDRSLYAIKFGTTTTLRWKFTTGGAVRSSPAVGADGTVYVGSADGNLYAVTFDGTQAKAKWSFATKGPVQSSPAIGADGTIYVGSDDGNVYAVTFDGTQAKAKWSFDTGKPVQSSPIVDLDETVYVGSLGGSVYALAFDGSDVKVKWQFVTGGMVQSSPAIGADGTLYVGSSDGKVYAISP